MKFYKYHNNGNHFILCDDENHELEANSEWRRSLCDPKFGIGADGILYMPFDPKKNQESPQMTIYNKDGGKVSMCGNGILICAKHLDGKVNGPLKLRSANALYQIKFKDNYYYTEMPEAKDFDRYSLSKLLPDLFQGLSANHCFINTGVPHFLLEVKHEEMFHKLHSSGLKLQQHHEMLNAGGSNLSFYFKIKDHHYYIETFERGVNQVTDACGTAAAALIRFLKDLDALPSSKQIQESFRLQTKGGEYKVKWDREDDHPWLGARPELIFTGSL